MTDRVGLRPIADLARWLVPLSGAAVNAPAADCRGPLNGMAPLGAKPTTIAGRTTPCATRHRFRAWASIVAAIIAVVSVLAGELWLAREAPVLADGAVPAVAAEVEATLGRVAEVPLLIVPID